ncbi:RraA family protein [Kribbella sp. NPDC051770]|uniref:RraA family protein n=1 Tax=Kribbella sp. NPDC051770 TaxID=3155413 RepID=UPI00342B4567
MKPDELTARFAELTTAHVADACVRTQVPVRCVELTAVEPMKLAGRVLPAQHVGSVDVFLEAFGQAEPGDVLCVDNGGRRNEACVGDLVVAEAKAAGVAGLVVWGLHRDTADVRAIGLPVYSLGSLPTCPLRIDPLPDGYLSTATIGEWAVSNEDVVLADEDGIIFVPADRIDELFTLAESIRDTEHRQAALIAAGTTLREQVGFDEYLAARAADPSLSFRAHLRAKRGAIEE